MRTVQIRTIVIFTLFSLIAFTGCGSVQERPVRQNKPVAAYRIDYNANTNVLNIKSIDVTPPQSGVSQTGTAGVFQAGAAVYDGVQITAPVYITNNDSLPWTGVEMQAYELLSGSAIVSNPDKGTGWFIDSPPYGAWGWLFTSGTSGSEFTIPAGGQSAHEIIGFNANSSFAGWVFIYANVPVITGISPTGALAGQSVTISGFNFSTTLGTVTFNGLSATVTSWNPTSVVATVPSQATRGTVVVNTGDANTPYSNPVLFTPYRIFSNSATIRSPAGITVDTSGNIYVAIYATNNYIARISPAGTVSKYSTSGRLYNGPLDVALDASGNLYVANAGGNDILKVAPGGGKPAIFAPAGSRPAALYFSGAGQSWPLYVANSGDGTISSVASDGSSVRFASGFTDPTAITVDAAGNVYVGDCSNGRVYRINSGGTFTATILSGLACPAGMRQDSAGNIYILDSAAGTLYTYVPDTGRLSVFAAGSGISNGYGGFAFDDSFSLLYISRGGPANDITAIPLQ